MVTAQVPAKMDAPAILSIITAIVSLHSALLVFITYIIEIIPGLIALLYFCACFLIIAGAPYFLTEYFGWCANPIGQPIFLFFTAGSLMLAFDGWEFIDNLGWLNTWFHVSMMIAWCWSCVLLVINIVLMVIHKDKYDRVGSK